MLVTEPFWVVAIIVCASSRLCVRRFALLRHVGSCAGDVPDSEM